MPRGDHGENSEYIHVQLRPTKLFSRMRTIDIGAGVKQVTGRIKNSKQWTPQNIMIPVKKVEKKGNRISIKSKKLKEHLHKFGIKISKIERIKNRGVNDYKHPTLPCPGSRIRSMGKGRGKGFGKRKGPIRQMKNKKRRKKDERIK